MPSAGRHPAPANDIGGDCWEPIGPLALAVAEKAAQALRSRRHLPADQLAAKLLASLDRRGAAIDRCERLTRAMRGRRHIARRHRCPFTLDLFERVAGR